MRIRLSTDLLTGLIFLTLGAFAVIYGSRYPLGTPARMGPGFYPMIASCGLLLMGAILAVRSFFQASEEIGVVQVRPLFFVLIGTLVFGLIVERSGFVIASILLVFSARLADRDFRPLEVAVLAVGLAAFIAVLFRAGLGLPLKPLPF